MDDEDSQQKWFEEAERTLYPLLPSDMHMLVKEVKWNLQNLQYYTSIAKTRKQLVDNRKSWYEFSEKSNQQTLQHILYNCLIEPYTRFLLLDVTDFKEWMIKTSKIEDQEQIDLLFDRRIISNNKDEFDEISKKIEQLKNKKKE